MASPTPDSPILHCLGVGDGLPSRDRSHSSYAYLTPSAGWLIDCGDGTSRQFRLSGLKPDLLRHLFLSHLHADHVGGLPMLMQHFWLTRRSEPLTIHAPAYAIPILQNLLKACLLFPDLLPFPVEWLPIQPAAPFPLAPQTSITAYPTTHLRSLQEQFQPKYPQPFEAFAFLINSPAGRWVHSADIGVPDDLNPLLAGQPVQFLLCELAHFSPQDLFSYLSAFKIHKLALIHLSEGLWNNPTPTLELARHYLPHTDVHIPADLTNIPLR